MKSCRFVYRTIVISISVFILWTKSLVVKGFLFGPQQQSPRQLPQRAWFQTKNDNNYNHDDDIRNDKNKSTTTTTKKTIVVVGGGWAGFTAADALRTCPDARVILLDASPRGPGGLSRGWTTTSSSSVVAARPVEAGIHGFWRDYANVYDTIQHRIGLSLDQVLTPYLPSILVSQQGRVAVAPVLGETNNAVNNDPNDDDRNNNNDDDNVSSLSQLPPPLRNIASQLVRNLPPPLDVALLTNFNERQLTLWDRLSGLGLLGVWADFGPQDGDSWMRYDGLTADQLFRRMARLSPALYRQVVLPLLHVLPMTTAYDCSAAAALSCFHTFALQSRGAFDVRWCRDSIAQAIFDPWARRLLSQEDDDEENDQQCRPVEIRGSARVVNIEAIRSDTQSSSTMTTTTSPKFVITLQDDPETIECDAVILAVGAVAAGTLAAECNALRQLAPTTQWKQWRGVTCVAVRLFLQGPLPQSVQQAMQPSPVVVCGPNLLQGRENSGNSNISNDILLETGFCLYDLTRMQDKFANNKQEESVLELDFFRADALADLSDDAVVHVALRAVQAALELDKPPLDASMLLDSSVVRARRAVSHFFPGSASLSPPTRLTHGIYMAGDWIDRTGHASWSTEKAVATARQAAISAATDLRLDQRDQMPAVIPVPPDSEALQALRQTARIWRTLNPNGFPKAPWAL